MADLRLNISKIQAPLERIILVVMGVTGVGKSTAIGELVRLGFIRYIPPLTTRPSRGVCDDKTHISDAEFSRESEKGLLLAEKNQFGYRYGYLRRNIEDCLLRGSVPCLDLSVRDVSDIESKIRGTLLKIYLYPNSPKDVHTRLSQREGVPDPIRISQAYDELDEFHSGVYDKWIDYKVSVTHGDLGSPVQQMIRVLRSTPS